MQGKRRRPTWGDGCVVVLVLAGVAWTWPVGGGGDPAEILVATPEGREYFYPLDAPREIEVAGRLGVTRLRVEEGGVRCVAAPCPRRLCMHMGTARRPGDTIVCVPNGVIVVVRGPSADETDAISR